MTQTRAFYERWSRLEEDKRAISDDLKELFAGAKHAGYESKALREAFRRKAKLENEPEAVAELEATVALYLADIENIPTDRTSHARDAREAPKSAAALPPVPEGKGSVTHAADEAPAAAGDSPPSFEGQSVETAGREPEAASNRSRTPAPSADTNVVAPSEPFDIGDIPDFLDRRKPPSGASLN